MSKASETWGLASGVVDSSAFLPALQRDNVEVVAERITGMDRDGLRTEGGRHHPVDCVIYATGSRRPGSCSP